MNIGKSIKTIRKQLRITQQELSNKTGISQTSLSKIEGGTRPSEENLQKIADALNTPISLLYILSIDESDVPSDKKEKFHLIYPAIKSLALQIVDIKDEE